MGTVRATRHNGRKGKQGVFKAGHNDRTFDLDNAGHIDQERSSLNVYWDCYQGFNITGEDGIRPERKMNFDEVELLYYTNEFGKSIATQNLRHRNSRHEERIRSVEQIVKDPKTCPEETIYQLGTMSGHEDPALFVKVVTELFEEMEKRFGSNYKILNWSLHMDEETPHIHERHVFFADDGYGYNFPKQEKACEAMGFERPNPEKKQNRNNNRKMSFDSEVRKLFIGIAEKHGVTIEKIPLEGKVHMEKNDFIIAKQHEEIDKNQGKLDELVLKISDIDSLVEDVAKVAYEKACDVVTETVQEETIKDDIKAVNKYRDFLLSPNSKMPEEKKKIADRLLAKVMEKLARNTKPLLDKVKKMLSSPEVKKKKQEEIAEAARESITDKLKQYQIKVDTYNVSRAVAHKDKDHGAR